MIQYKTHTIIYGTVKDNCHCWKTTLATTTKTWGKKKRRRRRRKKERKKKKKKKEEEEEETNSTHWQQQLGCKRFVNETGTINWNQTQTRWQFKDIDWSWQCASLRTWHPGDRVLVDNKFFTYPCHQQLLWFLHFCSRTKRWPWQPEPPLQSEKPSFWTKCWIFGDLWSKFNSLV